MALSTNTDERLPGNFSHLQKQHDPVKTISVNVNGTSNVGVSVRERPGWRFDTIQVHSGLEKNPVYRQCTLPIYNTGSFCFSSEDTTLGLAKEDRHFYSRVSNPTNDGFEKKIAALECGVEALSFASGSATIIAVVMSLAGTGDNIITSGAIHSGTHHQMHKAFPQIGVEVRVFDAARDVEHVRPLIDDRTKCIFVESLGNPSLEVPDFEPLAALALEHQLPLVVDTTLTAGGYFCQPALWGADIIVASASKYIAGHGTTLGGVVIGTGRAGWQSNKNRFPRLHGCFPGLSTPEEDWYASFGDKAYMQYLRKDYMRNFGSCLSPPAAQQLFIGVESLSLRCQRQSQNAHVMADWLRSRSHVAWVSYLGFQDHPSHHRALKYFQRGFGTIVNFGLKGGSTEAIRVIDRLKLIMNTLNLGDSKTTIGHHASTTHADFSEEEMKEMGVSDDFCRLSLGVEDVRDLMEDLEQAFKS